MGKSFSTIAPKTGQEKAPYLSELVQLLDMSDAEWHKVRPIGSVFSFAEHWIDIIGKKSGKKVPIRKGCLNYNPETDTMDDNGCPYCEGTEKPGRVAYLVNVISREEQENEPKKKGTPKASETVVHKVDGVKMRFKDPKSKTWTPVRVLKAPSTMASKLQALTKLNVKNGETYELTDPKYGMDIQVKFDGDASGGNMYDAQRDERTKLTDEEKNYLVFKLDVQPVETLAKAQAEWKHLASCLADKDLRKKLAGDTKKSSKKKSGSKDVDIEDDDDDYYGDSKKSSKKSKKDKKKSKKKMDLDSLDDFGGKKTKKNKDKKKSKKKKGKR